MSTPTIKGRGVVRNADGTVTIAGVAQINTSQKAELVDASEVEKQKNSAGKVRTLIVPENIKKVTVTLIPGGTSDTAATLAEAVAQGALPLKLGTLILASFSVADFNGTYVIDEDSPITLTSGGNLEMTVKGTKYETDFSGAALTA